MRPKLRCGIIFTPVFLDNIYLLNPGWTLPGIHVGDYRSDVIQLSDINSAITCPLCSLDLSICDSRVNTLSKWANTGYTYNVVSTLTCPPHRHV